MFPGGGVEILPVSEINKLTAAAKQVCASCPVQAECLEYAIDANEIHGVWGGLGQRDRQRLRRERVAEALHEPTRVVIG